MTEGAGYEPEEKSSPRMGAVTLIMAAGNFYICLGQPWLANALSELFAFPYSRYGRLVVHFRTGGMRKLAHHRFTWSEAVEIVEPLELRQLVIDVPQRALRKNEHKEF